MSRVYFHSPSGSAELRGSERAHMQIACSHIFNAVLPSLYGDNMTFYQHIIPPSSYVAKGGFRQRDVDIYMGYDPSVMYQGEERNAFTIILNTACVMGSDPVKLASRLHGQCEIHCYVEGSNRAWLAAIIDQGLAIGFFREDQGWGTITAFLRERDDEPVVTSYSVCEQFPNAHTANFVPPLDGSSDEPNWDAWYDIPDDERWNQAMEGLRARPLMEMKPDDWATYHFGDGVTAFDLLREYRASIKGQANAFA